MCSKKSEDWKLFWLITHLKKFLAAESWEYDRSKTRSSVHTKIGYI